MDKKVVMMKVDLHVRKIDPECYKKLSVYGFDLILADEVEELPDIKGPKVMRRKGLAGDVALIARRPAPILHTSPTKSALVRKLIRRFPNRIKIVEVDLLELRLAKNRTRFLESVLELADHLLKRGIPMFFSSGATDKDEVVPYEVLETFSSLLVFGKEPKRSMKFKRMCEFLERMEEGRW